MNFYAELGFEATPWCRLSVTLPSLTDVSKQIENSCPRICMALWVIRCVHACSMAPCTCRKRLLFVMLTNSSQFVKVSAPRAYFAIHTLTLLTSRPGACAFKHCDSLNNIARQNRTKIWETFKSIACAEGQGFVLQKQQSLNVL